MLRHGAHGGETSSFEDTELSAHMEDYIESISLLAEQNRVVRVRDIARRLNITMPSVTAALGKLKEKKLINYEKYGFVELTDEGKRIAGTVYKKHSFLRNFFQDVLGMEDNAADEQACRIEHHLSPEACRQLSRLVEFHRSGAADEHDWTEKLRELMEERTLADLKQGDEAVISGISGEGAFRRRLLEMGFRRGEAVRVVKYAPLRDPIQILVKGYHISLRIEEARQIVVRPHAPGRRRHRGGGHGRS